MELQSKERIHLKEGKKYTQNFHEMKQIVNKPKQA